MSSCLTYHPAFSAYNLSMSFYLLLVSTTFASLTLCLSMTIDLSKLYTRNFLQHPRPSYLVSFSMSRVTPPHKSTSSTRSLMAVTRDLVLVSASLIIIFIRINFLHLTLARMLSSWPMGVKLLIRTSSVTTDASFLTWSDGMMSVTSVCSMFNLHTEVR